jgi:hypothetical protein
MSVTTGSIIAHWLDFETISRTPTPDAGLQAKQGLEPASALRRLQNGASRHAMDFTF